MSLCLFLPTSCHDTPSPIRRRLRRDRTPWEPGKITPGRWVLDTKTSPWRRPMTGEREAHAPDNSVRLAEELAALRAIVEGTASSTGEEFFQSLVRHLSRAIDARYAF